MKTQSAHAHEDRLLDFAYEELPPSEARLVEQHLQGCSRCTEALAGIRGVRTSMARLAPEAAPEAGLDSLLAYAQQSARRSAEGAAPPARWWRRLLTPALGAVAVSVFGVLVLQVNRQVVLTPTLHKATVASPQSASKAEQPVALAPAAAVPPPPPPSPVSRAEPRAEVAAQPTASGAGAPVAAAPAARGLSQQARPGTAREDWSNVGAGSAGGFPAKKSYSAAAGAMADDEFDAVYGPSKTARLAEKRKAMVAPAQNAPPERDRSASGAEDLSLQEEPKLAQAEPGEPRKDESPRAPTSMGSAPAAHAPSAPAPGGAASRSAVSLPKQAAADKAAEMEGLSQDGRGGRSPSVGELLQQAETAHREGDPVQEVAFLRAAMTAGLQASQRVEVFSRLCQAEAVLGNRGSAISFCKQVVALAPGSREALGAQRLLEGELQAPAAH